MTGKLPLEGFEIVPLSSYASVTEYLYALKAGGMKFGIDRMQRLAAALDHPERAYPVVHVAGTNGKGSVSAMIESVMRTSGRRTGLYTSPHLVKLGERVQVDRQLLTEAEIVRYANELKPLAEKAAAFIPDEHATFFEFMTAMAFLQFKRSQVDIAIIETGMGGRLDATNVVQPEVSVITSIGLDHCAELGGTLELIAREKAGIIKPQRPVVIGRMPPEAEQAIREVAVGQKAPVHSVREAFGEELAGYPVTNLEGDYQRWNAATATLAMRLLPGPLRPDASALNSGLKSVDWPGRWQRLSVAGRALILDASHNPEGAQVLERNLARLVAETGSKPLIVAGALGEFRARALLEVVLRYAREVSLVTPHQARATPYVGMIALVPPTQRTMVREDSLERIFPDAFTCALGQPGDTVVITGSIYLLGEVLERLQPGIGAREDRLQDF
jgi:dihydrofolate synthase/folylpolyglutamate synthase